MTENKRFIPVYECVTQDNEVYVVCKGEHNADVVATALNEFYERNEYLEKENEWLKQEWDYWAEVNRQLIKKNKELEYRMEKLKKENEAQKDTIEALTGNIAYVIDHLVWTRCYND